ncbi:hypothetical protein KAFR_0A04130 [Kazachstania africana CBS 2517]|uniref:tRNA dimethylallyltransferase n=1 Tax=Kazachstania africana (strain ATCC 22294 / BCRC 22015 / CBS 2517 / CECT 1963 / NBRC 1671 / NRRL Y-8276) TaxID=1071382 RepID=H2AN98_KAZAF|nr:hypothetical protein KAFR_0A04130 [Kazachstania africana CBS 2517]CCF55848.1 hypothetical protein KAFR_0A04130 [Kazachstania africana CBS 2517]
MKDKIIVIAGTTGVGKSQLSIELAKRYNGEIINSDSMQVYKDIPIISNKHPLEEREGIPHHVMNFVDWNDEYYMHRFENDCINAIDDILKRGKLPIVVGGTHYYLQCLFNKRINEQMDVTESITEEQSQILNSNDKNLIYNKLIEIDPEIAKRYHPNDNRRVQRMLEIYYRTKIRPSEAFQNQDTTLKYDTLFLWCFSELGPLNQRLDDRVDMMMKNGALEDINQLFSYHQKNNVTSMENGVWQVIGFKEFLPWLLEDKSSKTIKFEDCVERMKIRTRQYAKKQIKWIQKMLIPDINGDIYVLNATDLNRWKELVLERATKIAESFMNNLEQIESRAPAELIRLLEKEQTFDKKKTNDWEHYTCDICMDSNGEKLIALGEKNWNIHLKSRRHKSNLTRGSKKAEYEKWKLKQREGESNGKQSMYPFVRT